DQRLQSDKFALISSVWDKFLQNSQNCCKLGVNITIDKQALSIKSQMTDLFNIYRIFAFCKKFVLTLPSCQVSSALEMHAKHFHNVLFPFRAIIARNQPVQRSTHCPISIGLTAHSYTVCHYHLASIEPKEGGSDVAIIKRRVKARRR
ncbi:unnamed protein product, partial [Heterotrigona itama]